MKITEKDIELLKSKDAFGFEDLVKIVEILRERCPWDREQTHESIRKNLIEETYEVVEGIDKKDSNILREELGDLMLQVVFHSVIGKEMNEYTLEDVLTDICKKLIRRHPHIFAETEADTTEKVLENWDKIKKTEKSNKTLSDELSSISSSLPALMRSEKVCKKIRKYEECKEQIPSITEEEAGELLFDIAARCDFSGIDAEEALSKYTERKIKEYGK